MAAPRNTTPYAPSGGKTSLVDRMNLSIHLRKYIKLFTRRWIIVVLTTAIGTGAAWHKSKQLSDFFLARSSIAIAPPRAIVGTERQIQVAFETTQFYPTQIQYLYGDQVLGKTRERMKTFKTESGIDPEPVNASAAKGEGSFIVLTVSGRDFEYVRKFAEIWAEEFKNYKDSQKSDTLGKAATDLALQVDRAEEQLKESQQQIQEFQKANNVIDAKDKGDKAQALLNEYKERQRKLRTQWQLLENQTEQELAMSGTFDSKNDAAAKKPGVPEPGPGTTERFSPLSQYSDLQARLFSATNEHEKGKATMKAKHPRMREIAETISDLRAKIEFELASIKDRRDNEIKRLRLEEQSYNSIIENQQKEVAEAARIQAEYNRLDDQRTEQKGQLTRLRADLERARSTPTQDEMLEINERGVGDARPLDPDKRRKLVMNGLLIGLALGLGIVYFLHRMDDRLELAEDIEEELEEPVLGQVPQLGKEYNQRGSLLVTRLEQHNTFAEALRGVRSALLFGAQESSKQVLVVTSAVPGDGKTTFTVNFAATLAKAGNKVLLVDADLRRGNIHQYFESKREPGMTEVLTGELHWQDVIQPTELETLHTINTGRLPGNPGELLISPVTAQFIKEAREHYDHILFDCPPLTSIDDTFCLLNLVDGLMFIVKAGHTSMRFAKNALQAVRHRGADVVGIVLNGITTDHPGYYYYYYYHDYYKTAQEAAAKGTGLEDGRPATEMAQRRGVATSIDQAARAKAGLHATTDVVAAEEQKKAELFKARRAARKHPDAGDSSAGTTAGGDHESEKEA